MTKEDLIKEFDRLIESHYSEEIDSRDEWLREIVDLKDNVAKKLTIPDVVGRSEQLVCYHKHTYTDYHGTKRCVKCKRPMMK